MPFNYCLEAVGSLPSQGEGPYPYRSPCQPRIPYLCLHPSAFAERSYPITFRTTMDFKASSVRSIISVLKTVVVIASLFSHFLLQFDFPALVVQARAFQGLSAFHKRINLKLDFKTRVSSTEDYLVAEYLKVLDRSC